MSKKFFFILLSVLAVPAAGLAQQRDLELLRDSLSRSSSVPELRTREVALARGELAKNPGILMERGLVLLRLFELTNENGDGDAAREAFEQAIERAPSNGWAHYGLGLALAGGPGVRVPTPGGVLDGFVLGQSVAELIKQDPRSRAGRQFIKALELDPTLSPAAVELANLALHSRNQDALKRSRAELQKVVAAGRATDDVTVALARVQSALGDLAGAEAASALTEKSSADALRARAEALLRQPDKMDAGAAAYLEGIDKLDEAGARAYFEDVRIVANERELAAWEGAGLEGRRAWLERFWDLRAAASGKTVAERLSEHYRRLAEAQTRFRRVGTRGGAPAGSMLQKKYDPDQLPFDDRGLIYVRHGEPERVLRTSNSDLRPNESWAYTLPDGKSRLFHFVVLRDGPDYRMVDDLLQAMDPSSQEMPYEAIVNLLEDRAAYDPRYNILATRFNQIRNSRWGASAANIACVAQGGTNCTGVGTTAGGIMDNVNGMLQTIAQTRVNIATENREAALQALASDSDRPVFDAPLPFYYDVYTFKGSREHTDVTAAIAIPGTSLDARQVDNTLVYSVQLSVMVIDTMFGSVTRRDTVYHFRSGHQLAQGEHLRVHTDLTAGASRSTVHRLVIRDLAKPGRGQLYGGTTHVPAYDAPGLMVSDIVLAEPDNGSWHRGNASLALVPPRQFLEGQPLTLFYELYNLPKDTPYRTEITLAPTGARTGFTRLKRLLGGSDGTVRLRFDGTAAVDQAGNVQELRRVTTQLKPGKYHVDLRVTNLQNQQVTKTRKEFVVIEKK